ncbi:MAG: radical SAM protein, partial [Candidatus Aenigmatarchaeota archaeon]
MKNLALFKDICLSNFDINNYPYKLTFAITYKCNYRCIQCKIWKRGLKREMKIKEIKSFVENFPYFKWINITGGEPFLRRDFTKIIKTFIKNSYEISLINTTTNGFNPEMISNSVLKTLNLNPNLLIVVVSLDG